jgi:hypothetical protein
MMMMMEDRDDGFWLDAPEIETNALETIWIPYLNKDCEFRIPPLERATDRLFGTAEHCDPAASSAPTPMAMASLGSTIETLEERIVHPLNYYSLTSHSQHSVNTCVVSFRINPLHGNQSGKNRTNMVRQSVF